jgi:hypothetical protein
MADNSQKNRFTTFIYPLVGALCVTAGFTWMYRPLGPIALGIILLVLALLGKR